MMYNSLVTHDDIICKEIPYNEIEDTVFYNKSPNDIIISEKPLIIIRQTSYGYYLSNGSCRYLHRNDLAIKWYGGLRSEQDYFETVEEIHEHFRMIKDANTFIKADEFEI